MTPIHETFLAVLRGALRGQRFVPDRELTAEEWNILLQMASEHKLLPMIYEVLRHLLPQSAAGPIKQQVRRQVILQTMRTEQFLELNRRLREAGLTPLVVKGIVCRALYPKPDHRPSADEDVLIPPAQLSQCRQILEDFGMSTGETDPNAFELPYRRAGSPLYIELHRSLFPKESEAYSDLNDFFGDSFRLTSEIEVQGQKVLTMHPTDHITYLIFHAFKHFLHSGFGIRQVCDILLFAQHYGGHIDWEWVRLSCRGIRAEKFAAAIFRIGAEHLGFSPIPGWQELSVDPLPLLTDILGAGVYGSSDADRLHSSAITLEAVISEKQKRRARNSVLLSLFPPADKMESRYPWLKERPWLLPAAWVGRMAGYLRQPRNTSATKSLQVGAERIALLQYYDILN